MDSAIEGGSLSGIAVNIGSTEEVSIRDLQQQIYSVVQTSTWGQEMPEVRIAEGYHGDAKRRLPDCSSTEQMLGWTTKTDLVQGLTSMWRQLR
jgi:nucleoside-diphosphate-sugar epimerase